MKEWFRYFRIWFLVCGILVVMMGIVFVSENLKDNGSAERVNKVCTETERVFDYGDVLTEEEEQSLRELIAKREKQTHCDIVLVTMNESIEEYAKQYDPNAYGEEWAMIKADNFYDEHGFGWNKYQESDDGDGVLLLDNWFRESDGKIHTWFSTSGIAMDKYSTGMIDHLLDEVYYYIEDDPYKAYEAYIETFYQDMTDSFVDAESQKAVGIAALIIPLIVAVVFIILNLSGKEGKKTTSANTYVAGGGNAHFPVKRDMFLRKTTTKRHIERSSSGGGHSGGGGGHVSSGGHSHGGGGHSR